MTRMNIVDLPREIVWQIAALVSKHDQSSLIKSSKRMRDLVSPVLQKELQEKTFLDLAKLARPDIYGNSPSPISSYLTWTSQPRSASVRIPITLPDESEVLTATNAHLPVIMPSGDAAARAYAQLKQRFSGFPGQDEGLHMQAH
jgi:hypothetical protein